MDYDQQYAFANRLNHTMLPMEVIRYQHGKVLVEYKWGTDAGWLQWYQKGGIVYKAWFWDKQTGKNHSFDSITLKDNTWTFRGKGVYLTVGKFYLNRAERAWGYIEVDGSQKGSVLTEHAAVLLDPWPDYASFDWTGELGAAIADNVAGLSRSFTVRMDVAQAILGIKPAPIDQIIGGGLVDVKNLATNMGVSKWPVAVNGFTIDAVKSRLGAAMSNGGVLTFEFGGNGTTLPIFMTTGLVFCISLQVSVSVDLKTWMYLVGTTVLQVVEVLILGLEQAFSSLGWSVPQSYAAQLRTWVNNLKWQAAAGTRTTGIHGWTASAYLATALGPSWPTVVTPLLATYLPTTVCANSFSVPGAADSIGGGTLTTPTCNISVVAVALSPALSLAATIASRKVFNALRASGAGG